jgi:stage V sporulation protein B
MSKKSFVKGAAVLAIAGLLAKVLGAIFRIPLTYIIGSEGMGLYQMAYPIYAFLLVASSAGLPVAISKMVSEKIAYSDYNGAHRVFRISLGLLTGIGIITSIILFSSSGIVSQIIGNPKAVYSILAIAPALFFVSILSAFRGYFQGMQLMVPTALSQIVEQAAKLILGLWLASLWVKRGVEYGAAGAVFGVTLSEIAALALILGIYQRKKKNILRNIRLNRWSKYREPTRAIIARMISIAIPVTVGASIMPLVGLADEAIVVNRLIGIVNYGTGLTYTVDEATQLYGLLTAYAGPLINFPAILAVALAMSIVPSISESFTLRNKEAVAHKAAVGIRVTLLVGLPAGVGMAVLSQPIIGLLYRTLDRHEVIQAGNILSILSFGVVFLTLIQSLTGILQGINKMAIPVKNLLIGAFFKVVVTFILVGIPRFNVMGAALGTVVCYVIAALLDFVAVIKHTRVSVDVMGSIVKPSLHSYYFTVYYLLCIRNGGEMEIYL